MSDHWLGSLPVWQPELALQSLKSIGGRLQVSTFDPSPQHVSWAQYGLQCRADTYRSWVMPHMPIFAMSLGAHEALLFDGAP